MIKREDLKVGDTISYFVEYYSPIPKPKKQITLNYWLSLGGEVLINTMDYTDRGWKLIKSEVIEVSDE